MKTKNKTENLAEELETYRKTYPQTAELLKDSGIDNGEDDEYVAKVFRDLETKSLDKLYCNYISVCLVQAMQSVIAGEITEELEKMGSVLQNGSGADDIGHKA